MTTEKVYSESEGFYVENELHVRAIVHSVDEADPDRVEYPVPLRMSLPPLDFSTLLHSYPECYPPDLWFVHKESGSKFELHSQILKATGVAERDREVKEFLSVLASATMPEHSIRAFLEYIYLKPFDTNAHSGTDLSRLFRISCLLVPKSHPLHFEFELAFFNSLANSKYDELMSVLRTELMEPIQDFPFKKSAVPLLIARIRSTSPAPKFDKDLSKWMSPEITAMKGDEKDRARRIEKLSLRLLKASKMAYGPVTKRITPEWKDIIAKEKIDTGGVKISMDSFKTIWSQFLHRTVWFPCPIGSDHEYYLQWIDKDRIPSEKAVENPEDPIAASSAPSSVVPSSTEEKPIEEVAEKKEEKEEDVAEEDDEDDELEEDDEEEELLKDSEDKPLSTATESPSPSSSKTKSSTKKPALSKRAKERQKKEQKEKKIDDSKYDFVFEISGHNKTIAARGLVLYAKWPWFRAMLGSGMAEAREKRATLPSSIAPNVLRAALIAIEDIPFEYTKLLTTEEMEWIVMEGGELGLLDVEMKPVEAFTKLVGTCINAVLPHVSKDSVFTLLQNAKKYGLTERFDQAMTYAIKLGKAGFTNGQTIALSKTDVSIAAQVIAGIGDKLSLITDHASIEDIKKRPKAKKKTASVKPSEASVNPQENDPASVPTNTTAVPSPMADNQAPLNVPKPEEAALEPEEAVIEGAKVVAMDVSAEIAAPASAPETMDATPTEVVVEASMVQEETVVETVTMKSTAPQE